MTLKDAAISTTEPATDRVPESLFEAAEVLDQVEVSARRFAAYTNYKNSGIDWLGHVPAHWEIPPLYARFVVQLGKMLDEKKITKSHLVPYLRNVDVQWDRINVDDLPEMDIEVRQYERFTLQRGDLLVCEGGEVGRAAFWSGELPRCGFQKALHRLRPRNADRDSSQFLFYVLRAVADGKVFIAGGNPNTIPHLTAEKLRKYRFPFPPRDEQDAIAAFLRRETAKIDALVAKKRRLIELLREKRTALISHAVTKGLNPDAPMKPSGIDWLGDVPEHWQTTKLRYAGHLCGGSTPSKSETAYWDGDIPWVSPKDMKRDVITDAEDHLTQFALEDTRIAILHPPVVLMVVRGMILAHSFPVGVTSVPVTINQDMKAVTPRRDIEPTFLMLLLRGMKEAMMALIEEAGHGTRVFRTDLWKSVVVHVPPLREQRTIVSHLNSTAKQLDALAANIESAISRSVEYRQSLISAAVTGKIDVRKA